jgi:hypothetical protein
MFKSLLYKEWIKLRLYWLLLFVVHLAFCGFLCLRLRHIYRVNEAMAVWSNWIFKGFLFYRIAEYVPLLLAVVLGCLQFFPETLSKRLRLVLHLPLGENRAAAIHLVAGLLMLSAVYLPGLALIAVSGSVYFPADFQANLLLTYTPWVLGGFAAYLLTAFIILEPTWRLRVLYLLYSAALLRLYFMEDFYNSYLRVLLGLAISTALLFLFPLLSTYRFGKGYGA